MNNDAKRRVTAAIGALAAYAATACSTPTPEPHQGTHELDKMDYAAPHSIERAEDYHVPTTRPPRARANRSGTRSGGTREGRAPQGGDLPPMHVIRCESGDNYAAENPTSTASGRYQITDGSWDGYGGYSHAADAPPEVQDAKARQMWNGGRGASHWKACL